MHAMVVCFDKVWDEVAGCLHLIRARKVYMENALRVFGRVRTEAPPVHTAGIPELFGMFGTTPDTLPNTPLINKPRFIGTRQIRTSYAYTKGAVTH